jgi:Guanine nucleotide exchange factor synembryn
VRSPGSQLSAQIGYGNAAGYLFNKNILSAPPPKAGDASGSDSAFGEGVNPITGAKERKVDPGPEMTDEEKEREAEKLFVLFDRLEKTGMVQNPIRKAIQEGKLSLGPFGP